MGGSLTPRKVPMTNKLFQVLSYRYKHRDRSKPWVFWHCYWSRTLNDWAEGPYNDRKRIMKILCRKAGVRYFRYHTLRHFDVFSESRAHLWYRTLPLPRYDKCVKCVKNKCVNPTKFLPTTSHKISHEIPGRAWPF